MCNKKSVWEGRFTYHFELLSCLAKRQSGATSSHCKCPSCPLLLQSLKALPFDPISLLISNSSPMSTSNKHSWYPFTTQCIITFTSSLFCFERVVADILNDTNLRLYDPGCMAKDCVDEFNGGRPQNRMKQFDPLFCLIPYPSG